MSSPEMLTSKKVFGEFKTTSGGGADSAWRGVNGSANPASTIAILQELGVDVFDFGAGDGKFLVAAAASGRKATGVELPENTGHKMLFEAVVKRINRKYGVQLRVQWIGNNIDAVCFHILFQGCLYRHFDLNLFDAQMIEIPGSPDSVYSFWVGIPLITQLTILALSAKCSSVKTIAVYRESSKWNRPEEGTWRIDGAYNV